MKQKQSLTIQQLKLFSSLNINRNLYEIYKDFFVKETKVFIKGYLNSYSSNNNIRLFITVLDIADNEAELRNGRKGPHIRVDPDGVEIWNGKREEITPPTEEELVEMENLLKDFKQY